MNDVIISVNRTALTVLFDAPQKNDVLTYQADGLNIYIRRLTRGLSLAKRWAAIDHQALQVCLGLHIPAISLKRITGYPDTQGGNKRHSEAHSRTKPLF